MDCCPIVLLILCSLNVMTTSAPWASEKPLGASQRSIEASGGGSLWVSGRSLGFSGRSLVLEESGKSLGVSARSHGAPGT